MRTTVHVSINSINNTCTCTCIPVQCSPLKLYTVFVLRGHGGPHSLISLLQYQVLGLQGYNHQPIQ